MKVFDASKTRMTGLPYGEKNYDNMLSRFHLILERYGQTDRQTDGQMDRICSLQLKTTLQLTIKNTLQLTTKNTLQLTLVLREVETRLPDCGVTH